MYLKCICTMGKFFTKNKIYFLVDKLEGNFFVLLNNQREKHCISNNEVRNNFKQVNILVLDRKTKTLIEEFSTVEEAKEFIRLCEKYAKEDGTYTTNAFEII